MLCPEICGRFGRIFNGILPLNNYTALLKHIEGQWCHATRMFEHVKIQVQNLFIYTYFHSFSKHKWGKVVKDFFDIIIYVHCGKLEITNVEVISFIHTTTDLDRNVDIIYRYSWYMYRELCWAKNGQSISPRSIFLS